MTLYFVVGLKLTLIDNYTYLRQAAAVNSEMGSAVMTPVDKRDFVKTALIEQLSVQCNRSIPDSLSIEIKFSLWFHTIHITATKIIMVTKSENELLS